MHETRKAASAEVADLLPSLGPFGRSALQRNCTYAHRALLVFPTTLELALGDFAARRLEAMDPVPSVLVRGRLCARYGLDHEGCDVSVTRLRTSGSAGRYNLEVFLFPQTAPALRSEILEGERAFAYEDHVAFEVTRPDESGLERLMTLLQDDGGLIFEGGGHNPHEGSMGSTILYFVSATVRSRPLRGPRFERFELYCTGDFSAVVDRHPVDQPAVADAYLRWANGASLPATAACSA